MLTIFHGEDTAQSRKHFLDIKQKYQDVSIFDGEKIDLTELAQVFVGGELFTENKSILIEGFLSRRKKSNEKTLITAALQKYAIENDLILWEGKEVEKSILNQFKSAKVNIFKLPQTLFLFIDNLKPNNGKRLVTLFHQTLVVTEVEMIFFMLVRQFRMLLALSSPTNEKIEEIKRLAPWQLTKLQSQAKLFTVEQLTTLYNKLFILERGQKTGSASSPLVTSIDFLLLEI